MSKLVLQIIGNVGGNAEINTLNSGNKVVNFSVAHLESFKNKEGVKEQITTWVRCADFREHGLKLAQYIKKGDQVEVTGKPVVSAYINDAGEAVARQELRVSSITLLSGNSDSKTE